MREIDTRGLSCPEPVLKFHQALAESPEPFDVLVDNEVSRENVTRAAQKKGFTVTVKDEANGVSRLELRK